MCYPYPWIHPYKTFEKVKKIIYILFSKQIEINGVSCWVFERLDGSRVQLMMVRVWVLALEGMLVV